MPDLHLAWFRRDLRLADNPAFAAAANRGDQVLPVYCHDPEAAGDWTTGAASRWWHHHALADLEVALGRKGLPLLVLEGPAEHSLPRLARALSARCVHWNRSHEPWARAQARRVSERLADASVSGEDHEGSLLWSPAAVRNQSGDPFRVFTPFWKRARTLPIGPPVHPSDKPLEAPPGLPDSVPLEALGLLPSRDWADRFPSFWDPSLAGATKALDHFLQQGLAGYSERRDRPAQPGTSRLSPYLQTGQLGPRQVWHAVHTAGLADTRDGFKFLSEVAWREFGHHLLHHFPHTTDRALRPEWDRFPWQADAQLQAAWQRGQTGFPIVDAGMRQLWQTGWMHNRVRMIAASVLVKHLLQPWQAGARWFWDTLVDADLASNTMGWQWAAGCGADAAPYFRIFNPTLQGEKFDPDGDYVRRWVPELSRLPARWIHQPWSAPANTLKEAGVRLDDTYPRPRVELSAGRKRALDALSAFKALQAA